jgi:hypothetical protein
MDIEQFTGFNLFYTKNGVKNLTEFQPNFKLKAYRNERRGIAVSTGLILVTPLTRATGNPTIGMFYSNMSKNVNKFNGLRLTGGIYTVAGANKNFGTKNGAIVGIEQPLRGKLSLLGDWYSGKNRFGYTSTGLSYAVTKRQYLYLGYNFGNSGRGNNTMSAYYGLTF